MQLLHVYLVFTCKDPVPIKPNTSNIFQKFAKTFAWACWGTPLRRPFKGSSLAEPPTGPALGPAGRAEPRGRSRQISRREKVRRGDTVYLEVQDPGLTPLRRMGEIPANSLFTLCLCGPLPCRQTHEGGEIREAQR